MVEVFRSDYWIDMNVKKKIFHANMLKNYIGYSECADDVVKPVLAEGNSSLIAKSDDNDGGAQMIEWSSILSPAFEPR